GRRGILPPGKVAGQGGRAGARPPGAYAPPFMQGGMSPLLDRGGRMGNKTNMRLLGVALAVMRSMDLSPELSTDGVGDPQINFVIDGLHARLNFYDCKKDGRCGSLQLETALDLDDGTTYFVANRFNKQYRYVRMFLDEEMDPYLQY